MGPADDPAGPGAPHHAPIPPEHLTKQSGRNINVSVDDKAENSLHGHTHELLALFTHLQPAALERGPRPGGCTMNDLGVRSSGNDSTSGLLIPVLRGQAYRDMRTPTAPSVVIKRRRCRRGRDDAPSPVNRGPESPISCSSNPGMNIFEPSFKG